MKEYEFISKAIEESEAGDYIVVLSEGGVLRMSKEGFESYWCKCIQEI